MKIGIVADHAGFEEKKLFVKYLEKMGFEISDYGTLKYYYSSGFGHIPR
jgi:ribose 5-phosphate isomerase B